ncbi:MAG TPA: hypothetical protein VNR61_19205 [Niallia sp.]|nr:hypothetical protein [Niallia sp.]
MMIENFIQRGLVFKGNVNKTNFTDFSKWVNECTLHLQKWYATKESTKQFIEKSNMIIDTYLSEELLLEDTMDYILGLLDAVLEHEKINNEEKQNFFSITKK